MRLRVERIRLIGTDRDFSFQPGLNIIAGSIATGKSTLLRCIRGLFGTGLDNFSLEARKSITSLAGHITIGDQSFDIVRPFVTTRTALVDVAGENEVLRLPVLQANSSSQTTYGSWLLRKLGLPLLQVPEAPTKPDSETSPVTINDYMMYCSLSQGEIDNSVFGHKDPFRNIKRKYVFEILYGRYNVEVAQLKDELRQVSSDLRRLQDQTKIFKEFLEGTPFENQAQIEREARETSDTLKLIESQVEDAVSEADSIPESARLRATVRRMDDEISQLETQIKAEQDSKDQLLQLVAQLETQSKRLTRSIVADELLSDFDFLICPRCGSTVRLGEDPNGSICYLCKQAMLQNEISKEDLLKEQNRIERQIDETNELMNERDRRVISLGQLLHKSLSERLRVTDELDYTTKNYVSEQASQIAESAKRRAELRERLRTLTDFLQLFARFDDIQQRIAELENARIEIEAKLDAASSKSDDFEERIKFLEMTFREVLNQFQRPVFSESGPTGINKTTYMPVLDGRRFDELQSQGLIVMVNVAHAVAHQLTSLKFGLKLPNILFIDGLTGNMGYEGLDQTRIEAIYRFLISIGQEYGDQLQILVVDNTVPVVAKDYVRAILTEENKLIPHS